jgi:hypothetical protein
VSLPHSSGHTAASNALLTQAVTDMTVVVTIGRRRNLDWLASARDLATVGAEDQSRTDDTRIFSAVLYH